MKLVRFAFLCVATLTVACFLSLPSMAQNCDNHCSGAFPWDNYFSSPYAASLMPAPPYYSVHPPVYYSVPVPRTYGYSPYAYSGNVRTPDVEAPKTAMIINPYASENAEKKEQLKTASRSRMVFNPFVSDKSETTLTSTSQ